MNNQDALGVCVYCGDAIAKSDPENDWFYHIEGPHKMQAYCYAGGEINKWFPAAPVEAKPTSSPLGRQEDDPRNGFLVEITMHTDDARQKLASPEDVRHRVGFALEANSELEEEIDFTIVVTGAANPTPVSVGGEQFDYDRIEAKIRSKIDMSSASPADWIYETLAVLEAEEAVSVGGEDFEEWWDKYLSNRSIAPFPDKASLWNAKQAAWSAWHAAKGTHDTPK